MDDFLSEQQQGSSTAPAGQTSAEPSESAKHFISGKSKKTGGSDPVRNALQEVFSKRALEAIYWENPLRAGIFLAGFFTILYLLSKYRVHFILGTFFMVTTAFSIFVSIFVLFLKKLQKSNQKNPFDRALKYEVSLSVDFGKNLTERILSQVNAIFCCFRDLVFAKNIATSAKFLFLNYLLYRYNGIFPFAYFISTIIVGLFSVPIVYSHYQKQIDELLSIAFKKYSEAQKSAFAKLPPNVRDCLKTVSKSVKSD